jgi:hypothetical protein
VTDYFRIALGLSPEPPAKIEAVITPIEMPHIPAVFYTTLVNNLLDAGIPIKPHTFTPDKGVCYQVRDNITHGKLEWESWDFGKSIRFTWTNA